MKSVNRSFIKYMVLLAILQTVLVAVYVFNLWGDGPLQDGINTIDISVFLLNYILGFPTGILIKVHQDMRVFLLLPINAAVQFFGFLWVRGLFLGSASSNNNTETKK